MPTYLYTPDLDPCKYTLSSLVLLAFLVVSVRIHPLTPKLLQIVIPLNYNRNFVAVVLTMPA